MLKFYNVWSHVIRDAILWRHQFWNLELFFTMLQNICRPPTSQKLHGKIWADAAMAAAALTTGPQDSCPVGHLSTTLTSDFGRGRVLSSDYLMPECCIDFSSSILAQTPAAWKWKQKNKKRHNLRTMSTINVRACLNYTCIETISKQTSELMSRT